MAFASRVGSVVTTAFGNTTAHAGDLPATVTTGNLLVAVGYFNRNIGVTTPSGWTLRVVADDGGDVTIAIYVRVGQSGDGGGTVDMVTAAARRGAIHVWQYSGWSDTLSEVEVAGSSPTGVSELPNPPSLTAGVGAGDNVWLALACVNGAQTVDSFPTSYSNGTSTQGITGGNNATGMSAERDRNIATEDPGTFDTSASDEWIAQTPIIPPAAAAAGVFPPFQRRQLTTVRM